MINYILQVILFQVLFLAIYDFFLSKETFFTKNRWYLIATPLLSFLIPFLKIPTFQQVVSQELIIQLPEIILSPEKVIQEVVQETSWYQSSNYFLVLFIIGLMLFSVLFLIKFFKIIHLIRKHQVVKSEFFTLVLLPKQTKAFSFFNFIFLGKEIPPCQQKQIIEHELVHSKQKHSLDLLFFEILKIVMWFNPIIYLYQKRITLIHEYISDDVASKLESKEVYINNLLSNFFQVENIAFVNQFYKKTLIKKRIIMMKKNQSKKMNQLKYLVLIPVLASMLFYVSCATKPKGSKISKSEKTLMNEKKIADIKLQEVVAINKSLNDSIVKLNEERKLNNKMNNFLKKKIYQKISQQGKNNISSDGSISFMKVDKVPTFPGCESGDKVCFNKGIQKHFVENFNSKMVNKLGLKSGKTRIFVGLRIDKEGNVVNVAARAPHPDIKEEVLRVMNSLPKVIPGEQDGKVVEVKYSIPFTVIVE
jgi:beta-lactamase regulating signal transducer with metallopeptidase domain